MKNNDEGKNNDALHFSASRCSAMPYFQKNPEAPWLAPSR